MYCELLYFNLTFTPPPDASDATILINFAQVISPKNVIEDGFPLWRPTREEIQEGFLVHVHVCIFIINIIVMFITILSAGRPF